MLYVTEKRSYKLNKDWEGNKFILMEKTWLRANKELINTSLIEWQNSATGAKVKALRVKLLCPFYHN